MEDVNDFFPYIPSYNRLCTILNYSRQIMLIITVMSVEIEKWNEGNLSLLTLSSKDKRGYLGKEETGVTTGR